MNLSIIAAVGKNNELGKDNDLIWRFKEDLKFFSNTTRYHKIVMGRKTFESLPHMLKDREHIVITSRDLSKDIETFKSIKDFLEAYRDYGEEIFNIGGASIYSALLKYSSKLYLTEIDASANADAYFPKFDKSLYEREILSSHKENDIEYRHVLYKKI